MQEMSSKAAKSWNKSADTSYSLISWLGRKGAWFTSGFTQFGVWSDLTIQDWTLGSRMRLRNIKMHTTFIFE
jgi:hypothetical protein